MTLTSVEDAEHALNAYIPNTLSMRRNYNLDRIKEFLGRIGNPQDRLRVVHIAGTSGKTSTGYFIRALLQEAGKVTGLTVSPHVVSITERVQVDGSPLADKEFVSQLDSFLGLVRRSNVSLTYFEVLVAFAYWLFSECSVDYAVVETGLGGLLDGTNVVARRDKVCVITDLGLDHTEILGNTISAIAYQKSGIIQPFNPVLVLDQDSAPLIRRRALQQHSLVRLVEPAEDSAAVDLPIFQRRNWALARSVFDFLQGRDGLPSLSEPALRRASRSVPPGRLERIEILGSSLLLDGAHNPQKVSALRDALQGLGLPPMPVMATFTTAPGHKLDAALTELLPLTSHLVVPSFVIVQDLKKQSPSATEVAERARRVGYSSVHVEDDLEKAFRHLMKRPEPDLLVTGSLYLVSLVRQLASRLVEVGEDRG